MSEMGIDVIELPTTVTVREAAGLVGVRFEEVYRRIRIGQLAASKDTTGKWQINRALIDKWIEQRGGKHGRRG